MPNPLLTGKKDFVRIPKTYRPIVNTLDGEIVFEKEQLLTERLSSIIENFFINKQKNNDH